MASKRTQRYNPAQLICTIIGPEGPHIISGYAQDIVAPSRRNPNVIMESGADGEVVVTLQNDKTGQIPISLQASSPSNDVLSTIARLQELGTFGPTPFTIQDINLNDLWETPDAMVETWPAPTRNKQTPTNVWGIICGHLEPLFGEI